MQGPIWVQSVAGRIDLREKRQFSTEGAADEVHGRDGRLEDHSRQEEDGQHNVWV